MEHPNRGNHDEQSGSNVAFLIGALIIVIAILGYFAWTNGYLGPMPAGNNVTAQTPTRRPVVPNTMPNVTPNKPVNNTPATNTPQPQ